jgi:glycosyltransferase involved in cell wall biosynthesis
VRIVLTIHHHLDPDRGAPGVTWQLAESFRALGHDVGILSYDDLPRPIRNGRVGDLAFPLLVRRRLRGDRPDVVDASTGDAWLFALRRASPPPVLVTRSHGLEHRVHDDVVKASARGALELSWRYRWYRGSLLLRLVAITLRRADLALFLNQPDLELAVTALGVERRRGRTVPNGIPDEFIGLPPPEEAGAPGIAFLGTYEYRKGVDVLRDALVPVLGRRPETEVTFLGCGGSEGDVRRDYPPELSPRLTVVPRFTRRDLPSLLARSQILVSASRVEGFPLSVVESMACGLAPIITDIPGATEVVVDGTNGLVVPAEDPEALGAAVQRLLDDDALRHRLRRAAWETAQHYGWTSIASRTLELYEEALGAVP